MLIDKIRGPLLHKHPANKNENQLVRILPFEITLTEQNIAEKSVILNNVAAVNVILPFLLFVDGVKQRRAGDGGDYPLNEFDYGTFTVNGLLQIRWSAPFLLSTILEVGDVISLQIGVNY